MRKALILVLLCAATTACSPRQHQAWLRWFKEEPQAAVDWAVNECGPLCIDDWDGDGVVEPEPSVEAADVSADTWSDATTSESDAGFGWGACPQWMGDALDAGWSTEQWSTLNWIMERESRCDPGAYNPSGATGLLQIMSGWADDCGGGSLFDPAFNLRCGLYVYNAQGWSAWSVY